MMNPYNSQEYKIIKEKDVSIKPFILFLLLFLIGIIIIICRFEFKIYQKSIILKEDSNYYLIVDIEDIDYISNNKYVFIDNKKYIYSINKIDNNYQQIDKTLIKKIYINISKYNTFGDYKYCYFLKEKNTLLDIFIKSITGG